MLEQPVRPPLPTDPVRDLVLYLTVDCNLACTYCFVHKKPRAMSSEVARKAVDFLLDTRIGGAEGRPTISFFGGEPFLMLDRMEEVIDYARRRRARHFKRIRFGATTNGTIATARVERLLRGSGMRLLVSIDGGPEASSFRPYPSGRSSYETVARNLPRLVAWSPRVVVRMTFHPGSLDLVENVSRLLELGAPAVALCPVLESPWKRHQEPLEAAYEALADWFIQEARQGRMPPLEVTWRFLRLYHQSPSGAARPGRPCSVGTRLLAVDPDGNVMPCHRYLYRPQDWLGTVDSPELSSERSRYHRLSSQQILGCDTCQARPVCGGGCRVHAIQGGLDFHREAHPAFCITTRAHARAAYRISDTLTKEHNAGFLAALKGRARLRGALGELAYR